MIGYGILAFVGQLGGGMGFGIYQVGISWYCYLGQLSISIWNTNKAQCGLNLISPLIYRERKHCQTCEDWVLSQDLIFVNMMIFPINKKWLIEIPIQFWLHLIFILEKEFMSLYYCRLPKGIAGIAMFVNLLSQIELEPWQFVFHLSENLATLASNQTWKNITSYFKFIKQWAENSSITVVLFVWPLSILALSLIFNVDIAFIPGASRIGRCSTKGKEGLNRAPPAGNLF